MILVDSAVWPWRGRYWAHLASDSDDDELHEFAAWLGLRRIAFQGDHYDVDEMSRGRALRAGAHPVEGRELVRRLRAAGRRRRASRQELRWRTVGEWPVAELSTGPPSSPALPAGAVGGLLQAGRAMRDDRIVLRLLARGGGVAAVVARAGCEQPLLVPEVVVEP